MFLEVSAVHLPGGLGIWNLPQEIGTFGGLTKICLKYRRKMAVLRLKINFYSNTLLLKMFG